MISVSFNTPQYSKYTSSLTKRTPQMFAGRDVSDLIAKGDKALNQNDFRTALEAYSQAGQLDSGNIELYRKLGKTYTSLKSYKEAEESYKKYLEEKPEDDDCWVELGESQRLMGHYQEAIESFKKASSLDEANDMARRKVLETENNIKSIFAPEAARRERNEYASKNLRTAINMAVDYMTPAFMKDLQDVTITFGETASMGGTSNIAQYENYKKTITVSNNYIYASPQVIAAYLSHESIHAKDKDSYTSIREEQDAYEVAAKFWIKNSNGIKDPEMDYAAELYQKSPSALQSRVEEIYKLRDPGIAKTSPNHPPMKLFHSAEKEANAASQSLKTYDVIA